MFFANVAATALGDIAVDAAVILTACCCYCCCSFHCCRCFWWHSMSASVLNFNGVYLIATNASVAPVPALALHCHPPCTPLRPASASTSRRSCPHRPPSSPALASPASPGRSGPARSLAARGTQGASQAPSRSPAPAAMSPGFQGPPTDPGLIISCRSWCFYF